MLTGVKPGTVQRGKNLDHLRSKLEGKVDYHVAGKEDYPTVKEMDVKVPMSKSQLAAYKATAKGKASLAYKIKHGIPPSKAESGQMNAFLNASRQISNTAAAYNTSAADEISPKVQRIVSDIRKSYASDPNYKGVLYSNYLDSGVNRVKKHLKIPYAEFTGKTSEKDRKRIVADYNSGKIKQLLISGAGSEGLDLKGTKMVQLMEPHWNKARLDQVKGRAVRYKSHADLPESERNVIIKNYYSTLPERKGIIQKIFRSKPKKSADEYLKMLSNQKQQLNQDFLSTLREAS